MGPQYETATEQRGRSGGGAVKANTQVLAELGQTASRGVKTKGANTERGPWRPSVQGALRSGLTAGPPSLQSGLTWWEDWRAAAGRPVLGRLGMTPRGVS